MSTTEGNGGGRATVALVDAKVDGLHDLIRAEFSATQRQLDDLKTLPVAVQSLVERMQHAETRITDLENDNDARQGWRKVTLPQILIGVVSLSIAAANIVVLLNVN